ncbi:MAG: hypothetical protein M3Z35_03080 [Nitrospirota bacterium]|nr:hypothetical protein [Nitrospirota bacterium]
MNVETLRYYERLDLLSPSAFEDDG